MDSDESSGFDSGFGNLFAAPAGVRFGFIMCEDCGSSRNRCVTPDEYSLRIEIVDDDEISDFCRFRNLRASDSMECDAQGSGGHVPSRQQKQGRSNPFTDWLRCSTCF